MIEKSRQPSVRCLRVAGLFAGIGGVELGLRNAGHEATLLCELDPGATAVLEERFAGSSFQSDVRMLERLPRGTELLAAGFPCQDLSQAGKTAGLHGKQSGLVNEVFRLTLGQRIPWVLLENVPFMLQLLGGRAMEHIVRAFEQQGYSWAYRVVDTRAFGLPQRRQRVIFVASLVDDPRTVLFADDVGGPTPPSSHKKHRPACGFYWTEGNRGLGWAVDCVPTIKGGSTVGIPSPPAIWLESGEIVRPDIRDAERLQGFSADWSKPAEQVVRSSLRWKLVGNAVTVDVAQWVGTRLGTPGQYDGALDTPLDSKAAWPGAASNVGHGRFAAPVSAWPARRSMTPLGEFLQYPTVPLSLKATLGFQTRFKKSSLHKPEGFLQALESHVQMMKVLGKSVSANGRP